jgi:hypothetical protein
MERRLVQENDASRETLRNLTAGLSEADYDCLVGEWTVTAWLCHLAFWDRVVLSRLKVLRTPESVAEKTSALSFNSVDLVDCVNDGCHLLSRHISGPDAAQIAVESAEEADAHVAQLNDEFVRQIESCGMGRVLSRSLHRLHHLEKIQAALAARAGRQA